MSNKDITYTTKYKILNGKVLYNFHSQNPSKQIQGPRGTTPSSTITEMRNFQESVCCTITQACYNLVVNGDFTNGDLRQGYSVVPGWQFIDSDGNNIIIDNPTSLPPIATTRVMELGNLYNKCYLQQTIPTKKDVSYTLSYYLFDAGNVGVPAPSGNWDENQNLIYFSASVSNDNTPIGDVISYAYPAVDNGFGWIRIVSRFVATSNATLLTFTSSQPPRHFYLTGISVSCA